VGCLFEYFYCEVCALCIYEGVSEV